jgi:hypothetical protein
MYTNTYVQYNMHTVEYVETTKHSVCPLQHTHSTHMGVAAACMHHRRVDTTRTTFNMPITTCSAQKECQAWLVQTETLLREGGAFKEVNEPVLK